LGFDGPNGWVPNNTRFDNQYYEELVGEGDSLEAQMEGAPQWRQTQVINNETELLDRWQWVGFPQGRQVIMLNADIALVRQLDDQNIDADGKAGCKFVERAPFDVPECPVARSSVYSHMVDYRNDNKVFLEDFRAAMEKMVNVGYTIGNDCDEDGNCKLVRTSSGTTSSGTASPSTAETDVTPDASSVSRSGGPGTSSELAAPGGSE